MSIGSGIAIAGLWLAAVSLAFTQEPWLIFIGGFLAYGATETILEVDASLLAARCECCEEEEE